MNSSDSSPEASSQSGTDSSFDFAEAARTLTELQHQLEEIEDANGTIEEAEKLTTRLKTVVKNTTAVSENLQSTAEDLATACQHLNDRSAVSSDTIDGLTTVIQQLSEKMDVLRQELSSNPQPDRTTNETIQLPFAPSWRVRWDIAGVFVLMLLVIGLQLRPEPAPTDQPADENALTSGKNVPTYRQVDVQVLNGVGKSGLAARLKTVLEEEGVSVTNVGNAPIGSIDQTTIYVHRNTSSAARQIARLLGIPIHQVQVGPTSQSGFGITIVIGDDFESLKPFDG